MNTQDYRNHLVLKQNRVRNLLIKAHKLSNGLSTKRSSRLANELNKLMFLIAKHDGVYD